MEPSIDTPQVRRWFIYATFIGIIIVLFSIIIETQSHIIAAVGYGIIVPSIVGIVFTYVFEKVTTEYYKIFIEMGIRKISEMIETEMKELKENMSINVDKMEKHIDVVSGAMNCGITKIYSNRKEAFVDMNNILRTEEGDVSIICIAGTDLFLISGELRESLENRLKSSKFTEYKCETLLLDPFSYPSKERSMIEEPEQDYYDSEMKGWIYLAINKIHSEKSKGYKIDVHFYSNTPIMFMLKIGNFMFVEQYHSGKLRDEDCMGKRVSILLITPGQEIFDRFYQHFRNLYDNLSENFDIIYNLKERIGDNRQEIDNLIEKYPRPKGKY